VPIEISVTINQDPVTARIPDHLLLCDFLRDERGLLGTRVGCNEGVCGSCTVLVDGQQIRSCLMLAAQVDGREILTVEGLATGPGGRDLHPLQRAFIEYGAIQCGFCTAGLLMASKALLDANPQPTPAEILDGLAGNLCRCTGYSKVAEAVAAAAHVLAAGDGKHGTQDGLAITQESVG
jgi:carbon-monoxide dehydrogenase small subunit